MSWRGFEQWLILAAALALRAVLAVTDTYALHPDEVFQSLEPAHRAAFGYGFQAWEFVDGARSWLLPGAFVILWKGLAALGLDTGPVLAGSARLLVVALSLAGTWSAMALAGRRGGRVAAACAGVICLVHPLVLFTSYRTMSEGVAGSLLLCAAALLDRLGPSGRRRVLLAGLVVGLGVFVRYQLGLVVVLCFVQLLVERRRRDLALFLAGAVAAGLAGGLLDWLTWGAPFHSFWTYVHFNFLQDGAIYYGVEGWDFYAVHLWRVTGPAAVLLLVGIVAGTHRAPWLAATGAIFVLAHNLTPHKELRFLATAMPVLLVVAAIGLMGLVSRLDRRLALLVAAVVAGALAFRVPRVTWADHATQFPVGVEGDDPILFTHRHLNPALAWVGTRKNVCGAVVRGSELIWSGGHTWFHRDVPLVFRYHTRYRRMVNYLIGDVGPDPGRYRQVGTVGDVPIHAHIGPCRLLPGWPPPVVSKRPSVAAIENARQRLRLEDDDDE